MQPARPTFSPYSNHSYGDTKCGIVIPFGDKVVWAAQLWVGTPFHWGASVKGVGCDCRGLISGIARDLGRPEADQWEATWKGYGQQVPAGALRAGLERLFDPVAGEWLPGDVLLLRVGGKLQHLAIYCGAGRMVHTYSKGPRQVIETPMGTVWKQATESAWRWRDDD